MTVALNTLSVLSYIGNDTTSVFPITFPTYESSNVEAVVTDAAGVATSLSLTTHYTLANIGVPTTSASLTLVNSAFAWLTAGKLKTGYQLHIKFNANASQPLKGRDWGAFAPERFEKTLDRLAMSIIAVKELVDRSVKFEIGQTTGPILPPVEGNSRKVLMVNTDEDGLDYGPTVDAILQAAVDAAIAQAAAEQAQAAAESEAANALASAQAAAASVLSSAAAEDAAQAAQLAAEQAQAAAEQAQTDAESALSAAQAAQSAAEDAASSLAPAWVATENVGNGGEISNSTSFFQNRKVQGNGSAVVTSTTPFGTAFATDGATITLAGRSNTNTVQIPYSDTDYGCLLNGTATLGLGKLLTLRWDNAALRWYEVSRNF